MKKLWELIKSSFVGRFVRIVWISIRRYNTGECGQRAVALTYYTLFAIVPVAALLFGIAKGFDLDTKLRMVLTERLSHHKELLEYVYFFADTTLKQAKGGVVAGVGVIALFATVIGLSSNIERAFNAVWDLPPRRSLLRRLSNYISCMVVIPVLMVVIGSAGVLLRSLVPQSTVTGILLLRVAPALLSVAVFFLVYLLMPNTRVRVFPALFAGIFAGVCYQLLQDLFVLMQRSIYRYNRIYGSFAALPLFMVWLRWSWEIALFGAELGFVTQNVGTGMFDRTADLARLNHRSRRLRQLAVARRIYAKFYAGGGASAFGELGRAMKIPPVCLERELAELIAAKVICRVENSGDGASFVPLQPDTLTIAGCVRMLDESGDDELTPEIREDAAALFAAEAKVRDSALCCPDDLPLAKLG